MSLKNTKNGCKKEVKVRKRVKNGDSWVLCCCGCANLMLMYISKMLLNYKPESIYSFLSPFICVMNGGISEQIMYACIEAERTYIFKSMCIEELSEKLIDFPFFGLYDVMRIHTNPLQFLALSQFRKKKKFKKYVHYLIMPIFLLNLCFKILLYAFYSGRHVLKWSDYQRQTLIFANWIFFHPNKFICISHFVKAYTVHGALYYVKSNS